MSMHQEDPTPNLPGLPFIRIDTAAAALGRAFEAEAERRREMMRPFEEAARRQVEINERISAAFAPAVTANTARFGVIVDAMSRAAQATPAIDLVGGFASIETGELADIMADIERREAEDTVEQALDTVAEAYGLDRVELGRILDKAARRSDEVGREIMGRLDP